MEFYTQLDVPKDLPTDIMVMNPYQSADIQSYVGQFLHRFFSDNRERTYVFGINPGRFGAGLTGVTFTDPVALEQFCGISNTLNKRREPSSDFVYQFIRHWGGVERFYQEFFLTAVSPLGFTRYGKNFNYYDDPEVFRKVKPFIVQTLKQQLEFGVRRDTAIVLGIGANRKCFQELNSEHGFFKQIYALKHPRPIMQYEQKKLSEHLEQYKQTFAKARSS